MPRKSEEAAANAEPGPGGGEVNQEQGRPMLRGVEESLRRQVRQARDSILKEKLISISVIDISSKEEILQIKKRNAAHKVGITRISASDLKRLQLV